MQPAFAAARDLTKDVPDFVAVPAPQPVEQPPPPPAVARESARKSLEDDARLADTGIARFAAGQRGGSEATGVSSDSLAEN